MSEKLIIELIRTHSDFEQAATRFGLKGASKELYRRDKVKKELAARLAALEHVAEAAFELWRMNRPIAWSQKEHLDNPEINATSDAEKALCRAVAEFLKAAE